MYVCFKSDLSHDMRFPTMWYCDQQRLRPACAYAQTDQSLCFALNYSMSVKLLIKLNLEFLSLTRGCTGSCQNVTLLEITCQGSFYANSISAKISCAGPYQSVHDKVYNCND